MLISISGRISSGKDTAADYLCTVHGFKRMSFAKILKDVVSIIFNWDRELLEGSTKHSREWRDQVDIWWAERLGIPHLTPRWVLQYFGTETVRNNFHNDLWIAALENHLRHITEDVVITDVRFQNELDLIKKYNGTTLRTSRGIVPDWCNIAFLHNTTENPVVKQECRDLLEKLNISSSEYSSIGLQYDFHLDNNKTIDELHSHLLDILDNIQ